MAGSKYAYVKTYELPDQLLPNTFIIVRLDGHSFHRFSEKHGFTKPNDERALNLMDRAAEDVMAEYKDIVLAFGESDEYSFLLRRSATLFNRRQSKILTMLTSQFSSSYVYHWKRYFPETELLYPPSFDGRIVLYPRSQEVRDYFAWRQVDTHINNLYNTTFWALIQHGGQTTAQAHETLRGTVSSNKHDILFLKYGINYNDISAQFRKGSVILREDAFRRFDSSSRILDESTTMQLESDDTATGSQIEKRSGTKNSTHVLHIDIIGNEFWNCQPDLLN